MSARTTVSYGTALLVLFSTSGLWADDTETRAVKAVAKLGGSIGRDDVADGHPVTAVSLCRIAVADADVKELAGLRRLRTVSLCGSKVTDAGLKELVHHKQLCELDLRYTAVTSAGLKELASLKELEKLNLAATKVTDAGLASLAEPTRLGE